jgi:hypothetical protein
MLIWIQTVATDGLINPDPERTEKFFESWKSFMEVKQEVPYIAYF